MGRLNFLVDLFRRNYKLIFLILFISAMASAGVFYDKLNVDNLQFDGNTISTTNTNGNLVLDPAGTGKVDVQSGLSTTGSILLPDGSGSSPALSFASDTDTGLYHGLDPNEVVLRVGSGGKFWISGQASGLDLSTGGLLLLNRYSFSVHSLDKPSRPAPAFSQTEIDGLSTTSINGGLVYNSTTARYEYFDGDSWIPMTPGAAAPLNVVTQNGNYTADASDEVILCDTSGGAWTLTLPAAASHKGKKFTIKKTDSSSNALTIDGNGSETIDGQTTHQLRAQHEFIEVVSDGSNWQITNAEYFEFVSSGSGGSGWTNYSIAAGNWGDLTSISLGSGEWDISAVVNTNNNGVVTAGGMQVAILTIPGDSPSGLNAGANYVLFRNEGTNGYLYTVAIPRTRAAITSSTTYYLKSRYNTTTTNLQYQYYISARRVK